MSCDIYKVEKLPSQKKNFFVCCKEVCKTVSLKGTSVSTEKLFYQLYYATVLVLISVRKHIKRIDVAIL